MLVDLLRIYLFRIAVRRLLSYLIIFDDSVIIYLINSCFGLFVGFCGGFFIEIQRKGYFQGGLIFCSDYFLLLVILLYSAGEFYEGRDFIVYYLV